MFDDQLRMAENGGTMSNGRTDAAVSPWSAAIDPQLVPSSLVIDHRPSHLRSPRIVFLLRDSVREIFCGRRSGLALLGEFGH
jgi:hypothetical protein